VLANAFCSRSGRVRSHRLPITGSLPGVLIREAGPGGGRPVPRFGSTRLPLADLGGALIAAAADACEG
jgi:hypothetical protein